MADPSEPSSPLPVVPFLRTPEGGAPDLEGCVCARCEAVFVGARATCSKCGGRDTLEPKRLSNEGSLYAYSIVYRSFPGVAVPYISAIVDLNGGGSVKGNLIGVAPDPNCVGFGMPVEIVYGDALGRKDDAGRSYLSYFFQPRSAR